METQRAHPGPVPLAHGEGLPLELTIDRQIIDVWVDELGIHFRQAGSKAVGHLSWEVALAASLLPRGPIPTA